MRYLLIFLFSAFASGQVISPPQTQHVYVPPDTPDAPFSNAVMVNDNEIYVAGHIGLDPKTGKPPLKVEDEARAVMDSNKKSLAVVDSNMADLVSVQVYCTDLSTYDAFNRVYRTYFVGKLPARAFIGVNKLLLNARFEVQGIAVKKRH
jgi:enamine deaminase RidA (YjgF/YER057c/UK114 family)